MIGLSSVPIIIPHQRTSSVNGGIGSQKYHMQNRTKRTFAGRIQRLHVEDVDALHLTQDLQSFETRRLLEVRGDGSRGGAGAEEVV